jgi:hypothetical protein
MSPPRSNHTKYSQKHIIEEFSPFKTNEAVTIDGYIYIRMMIRTTPNRPDLIVYQDTDIGRSFVFCFFLSNFKDVEIKQTLIAKIAGYLGCSIKLKEWAT